jgi:hypothetical protein
MLLPRSGGTHGDRAQAVAIATLAQARLGSPGPGQVRTGGQPITAGLLRGRGDVEGKMPSLHPHQSLKPSPGWHMGEVDWR